MQEKISNIEFDLKSSRGTELINLHNAWDLAFERMLLANCSKRTILITTLTAK